MELVVLQMMASGSDKEKCFPLTVKVKESLHLEGAQGNLGKFPLLLQPNAVSPQLWMVSFSLFRATGCCGGKGKWSEISTRNVTFAHGSTLGSHQCSCMYSLLLFIVKLKWYLSARHCQQSNHPYQFINKLKNQISMNNIYSLGTKTREGMQNMCEESYPYLEASPLICALIKSGEKICSYHPSMHCLLKAMSQVK